RMRIDGYEPTSGDQKRKAGTEWHLRHGQGIRRARRLHLVAVSSGLLTIVFAVLLFLLWWWKYSASHHAGRSYRVASHLPAHRSSRRTTALQRYGLSCRTD